MTRHKGWDVRVSPAVDRTLLAAARRHSGSSDVVRDVKAAMRRLGENGTRARGAKKLRTIEQRVHRWRDELEEET
ncbi:MAG: hypothetical protein U9O18_05140 [Chloroflexota bacterium]|nr:hypothetical protein [Chloroflexota bacterium]